MARPKTVSIVSGVVLRNVFNLSDKSLRDRKVTKQNEPGEPLAYDLAEVVDKCGDLIRKSLGSGNVDLDQEMDELKRMEIQEKVRKLRIDNDVQEGLLVPASDVEKVYTRGLRSICDSLDAWVGMVSMENPEITPAVKDSMNRRLIEIRNKIASTGISDD